MVEKISFIYKEQENEQEVTSPKNDRVDLSSGGRIYSNLNYCASIMGKSGTEREKVEACIFFPSPLYWTRNQ
jgi:hypothetical protein